MNDTKPLALVTGASAGIGATFARRLARNGFGLILVARRRDRLEALARELGGAEVLSADLTRAAELKLVEDRIAAAPNLDLLVNNAGFGTLGRYFDIPVESQDQMHRLHVMATMRLTHAALRAMVPRRKGGVINVSSVAAFGQSPQNVSYCSTKAWMNSFTEGLRMELKIAGSPVEVQALCPGFTVTEFQDTAGIDPKTIASWLWMPAEDVVDASLRGLARGKSPVVPGGIYKLIVRLESWMPRGLRNAIVVRMARRSKR
ncbi:Short-chain dehydrogenase/reductase SDR [Candidatus Sulfopaludibacter sp. SbA4]|nr:Short-chain dehydrogenase/reductase SDR [Candidatus Sulfopaludibacter sp. SbA4]